LGSKKIINKKIIERLLIFTLGIPAVFALVFLFPIHGHLPMIFVVILCSALGAVEFSKMLRKKQIFISKIESFFLGALIPAAATLEVSLDINGLAVPLVTAGALWVLLSQIKTKNADIESVINRLAGGFSVLIYPGFFMHWIIKMNLWESSGTIFLFLLITFGNDSVAWLFGTLFGKNNRGIISVSPNKSIAGFIGGLLGSMIISTSTLFLFPSVFFVLEYPSSLIIIFAAVLGLFTGIFANLGDLAESAIKRSCEFKDSGNMIMGRGGILDSIDSIAVAAPVFYLFFNYFFYNI
jgi:phosphatidate cytidylyltransferase